MITQKKKDGEKSLLLQACGEHLFGCPGKTRITQGIYTVEGEDVFNCFCKRAVWVPSRLSIDRLKEKFKTFGALFPSCLDSQVVVGICGKNPTRTAHATDCSFMILYLTAKKKFVVAGIASFDHSQLDEYTKPLVSLNSLSSDPGEILDCINWIRKEAKDHDKEKVKKRPRTKRNALIAAELQGYDVDGPGIYVVSSCTDQHRVFSEPQVLSCLKRKHMDSIIPAQSALYERMYMNHPVEPVLSQAEPYYLPGYLSSSSYARPVVPQTIPSLPQRQFCISGVSGLDTDSISSPEHVSTPFVGGYTAANPAVSPPVFNTAESSASFDGQTPASPIDSFSFVQPVDEESCFFKSSN